MNGDDRAVGAPERLHPLFLLTGLGNSIRGVAGAYALIAYLFVSGRATTALIGMVALLLFGAIGLFLHWRRFEYRVGADEIRIDSGIFSRTHRSIPFDRVQDVDITQGPVARLLGLARVKFETGSAGGQEDEGVLQAVALERAEHLRALIRTRRREGFEAGQAVEAEAEEERPPVHAMNGRRLLLAGIFNFSLALFAGLFGITQTMGDVAGFDPLSRAFWLQLVSAGDPIADFIVAHQIAAAVAGLLLLVVLGSATGIARTVAREFGFRLDRTDVGLRRRRGLLTRTDVTLPRRRAQAAIIATGPIRDAFGWRVLKLQSLARDEGKAGDHVLAPLADDEEIGTILAELGWRPVEQSVEWRRVSKAHVTTLAVTLSPLLLVAAAQVLIVPWLGAVIALGLVAAVGVRALAWHRTRYALDGDRLLIRSGWWRRRLVILPLDRVQSVDFSESLVSRWFGIAQLVFGVAGGSGFDGHQIPALPRETARHLRGELLGSLA